MKQKNWVKKVIILVIVLVCAAVYFLVPPVKSSMNRVFGMFASGDFDVVRNFVASYGAWAALVSFMLMIFQSVAAPLPAFLLTLANATCLDGGREPFSPGVAPWQGRLSAFSLPGSWEEMWRRD